MSITEGPIGSSTFNRVGTLTVDNTRSDFNGQLKCSVTWPEPAPYTAESVAEVTSLDTTVLPFSTQVIFSLVLFIYM